MDQCQLQSRLECLERQNRIMRVAGVVVVAILIGMGALETTQIQGEVRAKKIVLVDDNGKCRVKLHVGDLGSTVELFDANGISRVALYAIGDKAGLGLGDENDKCRGGFQVEKDGCNLIVRDESSKPVVQIGGNSIGPYVSLVDSSLNPRACLAIIKDEVGFYLLNDSAKRVAGFVTGNGTNTGTSLLMFCDGEGRPRSTLGVGKEALGLVLTDDNGRCRNGFTLTNDGTPHLWLDNALGQNLFCAPIYQSPAIVQNISPQAEYEQALAAYNDALQELNNIRNLGDIQHGLNRLSPNTPPWARMLGDVGRLGLLHEAEQKVEIARQRLERAKARINNSELPR